MRLRREAWIARVFFHHLRRRADSHEGYRRLERIERDGADLCTVIRTVFVVVPLWYAREALYVVLGIAAVIAVLALPYTEGWRFGVAVNGVEAAFILFAVFMSKRAERRTTRVGTGSASAIGAWLRAKKRRICPWIEWT